MNRMSDLGALLDELDAVEKRIKGERLRHGGLGRLLLASLAVGHVGPLLEHRAFQRRIRSLERERERLLGLLEGPGSLSSPS